MDYPANLNCTWSLTASSGKKIDLDPFQIDIEKCGGEKCTCDHLKIKTSQDKSSAIQQSDTQKIFGYCGNKRIPKIESKDNILSLHFHTDGGTKMKGFSINYHSTK